MKKIISCLVSGVFFAFTTWAHAASYLDICKYAIVWAPYGPKTCMLVVNHSQSMLEVVPNGFASQIIIPENIGGVGDKDRVFADMTVTIKKRPGDVLFFMGC